MSTLRGELLKLAAARIVKKDLFDSSRQMPMAPSVIDSILPDGTVWGHGTAPFMLRELKDSGALREITEENKPSIRNFNPSLGYINTGFVGHPSDVDRFITQYMHLAIDNPMLAMDLVPLVRRIARFNPDILSFRASDDGPEERLFNLNPIERILGR